MGIGSSYLFRLDDGYVDLIATPRSLVLRDRRKFIYAKRHIPAGEEEELSYNYKFPLEEKKIPCNCGSKRASWFSELKLETFIEGIKS
ncbi:hypothetical protein CASFOL_019797 [Castilleja foliolosa]|uniref:Uncharacterized protein n=1 Tax=Castilleja foliolosa TaxID=1961234 RepID=A0ABD3CZ15_9LAMI